MLSVPSAMSTETFRRIIEFQDGQLRFMGLSSMMIGLILLWMAQ